MIILLAHHKGGVGKSTLAVNIAAELQRQGSDVILVEADPTVHTVSNWTRDRDEAGHPYIQSIHKTGTLRASLLELDGKYDFVIVDAPGKDSPEMRTALASADVFVMPVQPTQPDLDTTASVVATMAEAMEFNPGLHALAVVNRASTNVFSKGVDEVHEYLSAYPEFTIAGTVLHERKAYQDSLSAGLGVVEMQDSKAKAEIQLLVKEVLAWSIPEVAASQR